MKRILLLLTFTTAAMLSVPAQSRLDSLRRVLEQAPVQEKVYIHTDNTCYFKGDTIWYKAYVTRADNNRYTDMSRLMYVELVSSDGLVVERQQLIVSEKGYSSGDFALKDSLYSGFYELRAYTRWMLNFCVTEHPYGRKDREQFYNRQMAADFFRQYGTIYSRVFPVYERPDSAGSYAQKYIVSRPKQRLDKELKPDLNIKFYPEGGNLIAGTKCRIAFEATTEEGEGVDDLLLHIGTQTAKTEYMGRGSLVLEIPEEGSLPKVRCTYKGKEYSFSLPKTEKRGVTIRGEERTTSPALPMGKKATDREAEWRFRMMAHGLDQTKEYGCAVLCRGQLQHFQQIHFGSENGETEIQTANLPTGVNNLIIFNEDGQPLADRLFFVNNHDYGTERIEVEGLKDEYQPYEQVQLSFHAPADAGHISIAVRDASTDDPTYDTGTMLTELLLSSELKGFVAYPDYYFEADDEEHRRNLDLLMLVQGWRRYDFRELTENDPLRYQPEKNMTVEGAVYKTIPFEDIDPDEMKYWKQGIFGFSDKDLELLPPGDPRREKIKHALSSNSVPQYLVELENPEKEMMNLQETMTMERVGTHTELEHDGNLNNVDNQNSYEGINNSGLRKEVTVHGELILGTDVAEVEMETTNRGRFSFNIPPYYGDAILFLNAHNKDASEERMEKKSVKGRLDESGWPDYYVKRNLFFPIFAKKYSFYQSHFPLDDVYEKSEIEEILEEDSISSMDKNLDEVVVKKKRSRGRHAIDYTKPACVYNAFELYNLVTDYGLSYGKLNFRRFPYQVSILLLGNYNTERYFNVDARMNDYLFYRSYQPEMAMEIKIMQTRSNYAIYKDLQLSRQKEIRLFTDFELRNEEKPIEMSRKVQDVTLDFITFTDGGKQYTFRDRRIVLHGLTEPHEFYRPDYRFRLLPELKDYRRTIYWNPNAKLDSEGNFKAEFYNGSRELRMKVCAEGLTAEGQPLKN